MYPVLILRSELACLVILVFLFFTSRSYKIDSESKVFGRILRLAIVHVIFDIITVLTVNHTDTVPGWLNWLCHIMFYLSAIFYSHEIVNYVVAICYPQHAKKFYAAGHIAILAYILSLPFLRIEYVEDVGTWSSTGPAAIVGYGLAFLFFLSALAIIFTHWEKMSASIKTALIPMMLVLMVTEVCQVIWRSVLFTGGAITIVTVGFFFSLENPVTVFKKKAMTDALTGVQSRSSYEEDIEKYDRRFQNRPGEEYTFVFTDLNDLRNVNNRFGHAEGDNYITLIASSIRSCMKHSTAVYRIGGDEFLILYCQVSEDLINKEIRELQAACSKASEELQYTAAISAGYARSSASYKSLKDVVKSADYSMYQNKAKIKSGRSAESESFGTKMNYSGLTDTMFDIMCASNDRNYPFITNLETNVTRISPAWKEFFGLEDEFYTDFTAVWKERIHPDDFEGYIADIVSVLNGHKKYHNYNYLAKKANGEYVQVSCHGSTYRDNTSGTSYFSGFIVNHGMDDNVDPITGLRNFSPLGARISTLMDQGRSFSVMKLKLNNFARVNMLYGYNEGNEVIRKIAIILHNELPGTGEVFCQSSVNFSILFETCEEQILENYYRKVSRLCSAGLETDSGIVPVLISGGALVNRGERCSVERIRGGLVFALEESHYYQRSNLVFYHELEDASASADISLLSRIHTDALAEKKYFFLRYQPIVDIASGRTVGAEALLRWIHPEIGEVSPAKFIAFLENDPCYYQLGLRILERAVKDTKLIQQKVPGFRINVNITALQLQNENFAEHVSEILTKHSFDPGNLVLELTERCKEMDSSFLAMRIAELRKLGVLVAFDDLGTGYSTINLLMDIPVDEIKLDRDFVRDLRSRENYQLFVRALVLGSTSGDNHYTICFEGIEDEDMLSLVSLFGNFLAQGYYFSKPLLFDSFSEYIDKEL